MWGRWREREIERERGGENEREGEREGERWMERGKLTLRGSSRVEFVPFPVRGDSGRDAM